MELIEKWDCADNIVNMVFDTTASNTGYQQLLHVCVCVWVCLQEKLRRIFLWLGCHHHAGEIVLTQIFKDLNTEVTRSSDIIEFFQF